MNKRQVAAREAAFLECRSFGHEWHKEKPLGVDDTHDTISKPFGMSTAMLGFPAQCPNCGCAKVKWITRSGEAITRRQYPDGYLKSSKNGDDVKTPTEYRHDYVESIFAQFEAAVSKGGKAHVRSLRKVG